MKTILHKKKIKKKIALIPTFSFTLGNEHKKEVSKEKSALQHFLTTLI
ncbi:MAG: hypothetical protein K6B18_11830 [Ruminococcus sp.]|jgi:hypothetical protein|nr:hypothetical protein [Ruminococcus sp.]